MNVLITVSSSGERTGEPQYTSTDWNKLNASKQAIFLVDVCHALNGASLEFTRPDEITKLTFSETNPFNQLHSQAMKSLKSDVNFLGNAQTVTTQSFLDSALQNTCMIRFLAHPIPDTPPAFPDNTVIGIIYAEQLSGILNNVITTKSRPVSQ